MTWNLRGLAPVLPYGAVLVGVYAFTSGWAAMLLYHAGIVITLTATGGWAAVRPAGVAQCRLQLAGLVMGGSLVGPALYVAWGWASLPDPVLADRLSDLRLSGGWWVAFVVYYATINPVLEEAYWRGYLDSPSRRLTVNDVLFGGYHLLVLVLFVGWPWALAVSAGLAATGWLWRQAARDCDGLTLPILSHAVADASLIIAAFLLAR